MSEAAATPPDALLDAPPTREDALGLCRLLLGREPAGEGELQGWLAGMASLGQLRQRVFRLEEARRKMPALLPILPLAPDRLEVESEATPAELAAMLARVGTYWARVGEEAPHWSVLTQDRFRPEAIRRNKAAFYGSGADDAAMVVAMLRRHGLDPAQVALAVDYGCGVGRVTLPLAQALPRVVGCDVSQPHMKLAWREAAARGIANVGWHRATIEQPMPRGRWGLWYSRIVLQHNPPPVMAHLLRLAFRGLAPGGLAVFQVPTHRIGYRFSIAEYLAQDDVPGMEMHVLPQPHVFALAAEARLRVLEVRDDLVVSDPGRWLSSLFVLQRPAR